jgi:D-serine deaminase-like pyridoxal phosphate-dependent protein
MLEHLTTPAVIVDLDIVDRNIAHAAAQFQKQGIKHRPHIKTHKSVYLTGLQTAAGAQGITCAKLGEAEIFAAAGYRDILVAYPIIGDSKLERLGKLSSNLKVTTCVDSIEGARSLSALGVAIGKKLPVYIEVNVGFDRCGVRSGEEVLRFAQEVSMLPGLQIEGVMSYAGHINDQKTVQDIRSVVIEEVSLLRETADLLQAAGIHLKEVSVGSSLSVEFIEELKGITEIRAGSYIFHDMGHLSSGLFTVEQCALRVIVTVVSIPYPGRAIMDAGSKTLTSDTSRRGGYGYVVEHPAIEVAKLNEEHGFLNYDPAALDLKIGDRLTIIPNHACVVPNLCEELIGVRHGQMQRKIPVDARGKNN